VATIYCFFTVLPVSRAFLTAVLLTPIALAASVKLAYSNSSLVFTFFTVTGTPISAIVAAEILARV